MEGDVPPRDREFTFWYAREKSSTPVVPMRHPEWGFGLSFVFVVVYTEHFRLDFLSREYVYPVLNIEGFRVADCCVSSIY
jgi:hypothetical protein